MVTLTVPAMIYVGILTNAHRLELSPYLIMGIIWRESTFRWGAQGDFAPGDPDRFPDDLYWRPNAEEKFPHSYGLMQLHIDGAGSGHTPGELLDISNNLRWGCDYLRRCLEAFEGDWRRAISAYNQGIAGCRERGPEFNRVYVDDVLGFCERLMGAEITVSSDRAGQWGVTIKEN